MDSKHQIYRPEESKEDLMAEKLTSEDESNELLGDIDFMDTSSITVPESLIDQVIGQDEHDVRPPALPSFRPPARRQRQGGRADGRLGHEFSSPLKAPKGARCMSSRLRPAFSRAARARARAGFNRRRRAPGNRPGASRCGPAHRRRGTADRRNCGP